MILLITIFLIFLVLIPFGMLSLITVGYANVNRKDKVIVCALFALLFGIAGYWFINPATDPDLVRYLDILSLYKNKNLFESFNLVYNNLYAVDIYFHIIAQLGDPQLLPAISVFIYYFIIFYILSDYKIRTDISNKDFIIYVLFVITAVNFCSIVNGIRWPVTSAIFLLAFYREIVQNKKNAFTWILYIISLFFHFSTLVYFAIRLVLFIRNKKVVSVIGISAAFIPHIIGIFSSHLFGVTSSLGVVNQIIYFFNRANMYFQWNGGLWADTVRNSRYYQLESKFYYLVVFIFFLIFINLYKRRRLFASSYNVNIWNKEDVFTFYLMIITVISFTMAAHTYIRFITPLIVCFCIISFKFAREYEGTSLKLIVNTIYIAFSFIGGFLNIYLLGSMMKLPNYLQNVFSTGLIRNLIELFVS